MTVHSYLICASPRSGSTLLATTLANTGLAGNPEEVFRPGIREEALDRQKVGATSDADFIPSLITATMTTNGVFGTKVHGYQTWLLLRRIQAALQEGARTSSLHNAVERLFPGLRYIWITRNDAVRQAVSYYRALMSDTWHVLREAPPAGEPSPNIVFDPVAIGTCHAFVEANDLFWREYFATHNITPLRVTYEELVCRFDETMQKVCSHIGLPQDATIPPPATEKLAGVQSTEWVERYKALSAHTSYLPFAPNEHIKRWAPF